jgi:hypothetical protein
MNSASVPNAIPWRKKMRRESEITTEEAGKNYLLARRRYWASPSSDEAALREYDGASDLLLATFADSIQNVAHAVEACKAYRRALVRSIKKYEKTPVAKAVGRT